MASPGRTFLKVRPLAARLGVHNKTIARWAGSGRIGRFKLNKRVVLYVSYEVMRFVDSARVAASERPSP